MNAEHSIRYLFAFCVIIIGTYLPTRNSVHGGDVENVFNHIACLLLRFECKYCVCWMGYYKARIGNEIDIIEDIYDNISDIYICAN